MTTRDWFTEEWATAVRDATRRLVNHYAVALQQVDGISKWVQVVRLSGLQSSIGALIVVKPLFREAVAEHIRRVLGQTGTLHLRAYMASRPSPERMRPRAGKHATPERIAEATKERDANLVHDQRIAALLDEASRDIKGMLELLEGDTKPGERIFKGIERLARRFLPLLWTGVVIAQFNRFDGQSQWQMAIFFVITIIGYHLTAWITKPFHDASERKYQFFQAYIGGKGTDGLGPLQPEVSRYEEALFQLLGAKPPLVISWETVVPALHYVLISTLLVFMLFKLPFTREALSAAIALSCFLIFYYVHQLFYLWVLLRIRYRGRSLWEMAAALSSSLSVLEPLKESGQDDAAKSE